MKKTFLSIIIITIFTCFLFASENKEYYEFVNEYPTIKLPIKGEEYIFLLDTGATKSIMSNKMAQKLIGDKKIDVSEEVYKKLLLGKLEFNEGMIVENIVAQMLVASEHRLYFYSNPSRDDASERMEIDFLIAKQKITSRHNISPLEVKSGKNYTLTSLQKFRQKFAQQLHTPYVLHSADVMEKDGVTCLPLYMTPLL